MKVTTGVFRDAERVTKAVRSLLGRSVPADRISVVLCDPSGERHEVAVEDESGVLKGVVVGGSIGGTLGALGVGLAATGVIVAPGGAALLAAGPVLGILQGALAGALAGIPLGGVIGMGRWTAKPDLDEDELAQGTALVSVHSDDLAATAREVLERAGADEIREDEDEGGPATR